MSSSVLAIANSGAAFGAALTVSNVYLPSIIVEQMSLQQFYMMKIFLTASGASTLVLAIISRYGTPQKPRGPSHLGRIAPYDGNIIGGAMIGAGMTLTGSCPGTAFVQVAAGIPSGILVLIGGALGGILYTKFGNQLRTKEASELCSNSNALTVPAKLKSDPNIAILAFEALLISGIAITSELQSSPSNLLNPIFGGLAIGLSQLVSVTVSGQPLGISGAFEEFGQWTWRLVDIVSGNSKRGSKLPGTRSLKFAAGAMLGAFTLMKLRGQPPPEYILPISTSRAVLGGLIMIFGSRLAGGCTSGHGISGMSLLSISSLYTVAAMFGGGIGLSLLMN